MAHLLKPNDKVCSLIINELRTLLSQFADDTNLFLRFERETLEEVVKVLDIVQDNIGLKVNYDKTSLYRIGSLANSNAELYTTKIFKWEASTIDVLGVTVTHDGI